GLLGDLFLRSGRICKQPVIVKAKPAKVASDNGPSQTGPSRKAAKRAQAVPQRPIAPPPDISGGIGIGGVF
ncbi:caspase family protein, partial [Mesorhizobium sp. M7A.F.Ca.US.001.04.1.1]